MLKHLLVNLMNSLPPTVRFAVATLVLGVMAWFCFSINEWTRLPRPDEMLAFEGVAQETDTQAKDRYLRFTLDSTDKVFVLFSSAPEYWKAYYAVQDRKPVTIWIAKRDETAEQPEVWLVDGPEGPIVTREAREAAAARDSGTRRTATICGWFFLTLAGVGGAQFARHLVGGIRYLVGGYSSGNQR